MTVMEIYAQGITLQRRMSMMDLRTLCIKEDWCDRMDVYDYDHLLNLTHTSDLTDETLVLMTKLIQLKTQEYRTRIAEESADDFAYIYTQLCRICTYRSV